MRAGPYVAIAVIVLAAGGATWGARATTDGSAAASSGVADVDCWAPDGCIAVGYESSGLAPQTPVAWMWDGRRWTTNSPNAPGGSGGSDLQAVSCPTEATCMAIGHHDTPPASFGAAAAVTRPLSFVLSSGDWRQIPVPMPKGAYETDLRGISCVRSTCVAVGAFRHRIGGELPMAAVWNGAAWRLISIRSPAVAQSTLLESVDCVSEDRCIAVGHYEAESVEERDIVAPLSGVWDGRGWTLQQPANTRTSFDTALKSVACPSRERCLAVGYVQLASGTYVPLTEAWEGVRWRMIAGPANPRASIYGELDGVSCVTPDRCTAVGYRLAPSGTSSSVAVSWDGSAWQTQTVPSIAGAANTALFAIDCPSTATCSAVGGYRRQTLVSVAFAAGWDGSAWSVTAT